MDELPDIAPFQRRLDELDAQMADPAFYANPRRAAEVSREHQKLAQLVADHRLYENLGRELADARSLAGGAADSALRELAQAELPELEKKRAALRAAVLTAMIPPEPSDSRNTVLEIRAGTGGEEAALFAAELYRMYARYAERRGWRVEVLSSSPTGLGGLKEVIALVQ